MNMINCSQLRPTEESFYIFFKGHVIDIPVYTPLKSLYPPIIVNYKHPLSDENKQRISREYARKILTVKKVPQAGATKAVIKFYSLFDSTEDFKIKDVDKYAMNVYHSDLKYSPRINWPEEYSAKIEKDKSLGIVVKVARRFIEGYLNNLSRPEITDVEVI